MSMRIHSLEEPLGASHHGSIFKTHCRIWCACRECRWHRPVRMFNSAIRNKGLPQELSSDNDPLCRYRQWQANLRILEVEEIKSVPYSPTSHPFIERLIGTIRREYLDRLFFWNAKDLERKLAAFIHYYNEHRPHQSLKGNTPLLAIDGSLTQYAKLDNYSWQSHCNGLC
jgi:putative transposase